MSGLCELKFHSWTATTVLEILPPESQVSLIVHLVDQIELLVRVHPDMFNLLASTLI